MIDGKFSVDIGSVMNSGYGVGASVIFRPSIPVELKRLHPDAVMPEYGTPDSAGFDLAACLPDGAQLVIPPKTTVKVKTGLAVWVKNPSFAFFIMSRSGLGSKGLVVAQGSGLVDADYQGEAMVLLYNRTDASMTIEHGVRIAQGVILPVYQAKFRVVEEFSNTTVRGEGGFGSTGK